MKQCEREEGRLEKGKPPFKQTSPLVLLLEITAGAVDRRQTLNDKSYVVPQDHALLLTTI